MNTQRINIMVTSLTFVVTISMGMHTPYQIQQHVLESSLNALHTDFSTPHYDILAPVNRTLYQKGLVQVLDDRGKVVQVYHGNNVKTLTKLYKAAKSPQQLRHIVSMIEAVGPQVKIEKYRNKFSEQFPVSENSCICKNEKIKAEQ